MKCKIQFIILILFLMQVNSKLLASGIDSVEVKRLAKLCKVWGYLKYYHPSIQKGLVEWDSILIQNIKRTIDLPDTENYNPLIKDLILSAGRINESKKADIISSQKQSFNTFDFSWIYDSTIFENENRQLLAAILRNFRPRKNTYNKNEINKYYKEGEEENYYYKNQYIPDFNQSMLNLFRYWNFVNYFYPFKHNLNPKWNDVLEKYIAKFAVVSGTEKYYLTMVELISLIRDCHGFIESYNVDSLLGMKWMPVEFSYIEGKTLIADIPDTLSFATGLKVGSEIISINGQNIDEKRRQLKKYCNCSTEASLDREVNEIIRRDTINTFQVEYLDSFKRLHTANLISGNFWKPDTGQAIKNITDSITYINLTKIDKMRDLGKAIDSLKNSKGIILDGRDGFSCALIPPLGSRLPNYKKVPFTSYYRQNYDFPGTFTHSLDKESYFGLRLINKKYKGKVIILINENLQSTEEFQLMHLRANFDIVLIGSNTAGSDGGTTSFLVDKNFLTYFTTDVVLYPDGSPTQNVGLKPDIYALPTVKGVQMGEDEVLNAAIKYINDH